MSGDGDLVCVINDRIRTAEVTCPSLLSDHAFSRAGRDLSVERSLPQDIRAEADTADFCKLFRTDYILHYEQPSEMYCGHSLSLIHI